jgi:hypothetical protein
MGSKLIMAKVAKTDAFVLGALSMRFETDGRGSTTISGGVGDPGGVSYGGYRMTSQPNGGAVARFVSQPDFPFRNDFAGLIPGSAEFSAKWRDIASRFPENFKAAEHEFIKRGVFDPLCRKIESDDGVDIMHCSHALQDVIWSTAVQHGPKANIVHLAFAQMRAAGTFSPASPQFDRNAIIAIYAERGRKDANGVLVHFSPNSPKVHNGVARPFVEEKADALRMLDAGFQRVESVSPVGTETAVVLVSSANLPILTDNPLDLPDLPLLEGENSDLRQAACETIGEWWLTEPNVRLGGRTPDEVINEKRGAHVRDLIRSIKYIGVS